MSGVIVSQSAFILLREGAEALLVIAALAAYLSRSGSPEKTRVLYWGAGLAVLASFVVAYIFSVFYDGGHNDVVEGATMLLAALVMIYVSGWLFARRDAAAWQAYLRSRVDSAIETTSGVAPLGLVAFLAVFREGAETILFLQALAGGQDGTWSAVLTGVAGGSLGLAVIFFAVRSLAIRLPLKPFFTVTAALLYLLAVSFVGKGVVEFQELAWLPITDVATPAWLAALGIGNTWETLGPQLVLLALVPVALSLPMMRVGRRAEASASS